MSDRLLFTYLPLACCVVGLCATECFRLQQGVCGYGHTYVYQGDAVSGNLWYFGGMSAGLGSPGGSSVSHATNRSSYWDCVSDLGFEQLEVEPRDGENCRICTEYLQNTVILHFCFRLE